jgi:hypothetical protein
VKRGFIVDHGDQEEFEHKQQFRYPIESWDYAPTVFHGAQKPHTSVAGAAIKNEHRACPCIDSTFEMTRE